jgi:predicted nucleic acid-binding protein
VIALVDACVAIDVLRGIPAAAAVLGAIDEPAASEIVRYELLAGLKPGEEDATEALMELLLWVPVLEPVARRAGELFRRYRAAYPGVDTADFLIAATALELDLPLVTRNVRHFPMLPGLEPAY